MRRDVDDLDDSFRSWRGRAAKREGLAARGIDGDAPPALVPMTPDVKPATTVHALRRAGKWPF